MNPADVILATLAERRLLLMQDKVAPNVVGILTGESLRTSWWSHPKAHLIFSVLSELAEHPDVLFSKLLYRKDTLIHRSLWPAMLAIGRARESWQIQGLSVEAKRLLDRLDCGNGSILAGGAPVKELESRLLAAAREIHTESGRHKMALESWQAWSTRVGCASSWPPTRSRKTLEEAAIRLGVALKALPWSGHGVDE